MKRNAIFLLSIAAVILFDVLLCVAFILPELERVWQP
jgi:hypothetical protein